MKKILTGLLSLTVLLACNNSGSSPSIDTGKADPAEARDELDVAIGFIKTTLNGKYTDARVYVLNDSTNMQYCDVMERGYGKLDRNKKEEYKLASIQDMKKQPVNDSVVLVNYQNSYEKQPYQLKLVRRDDQWLVDLKHTFENKTDSLK
jgi:hypothetical protein